MESIPVYVYIVFGLTLLATLYLFYRATKNSKGFIVLVSIWIAIQSVIGMAGFYTVTNTTPPRFPLLLLPPLAVIIFQFTTKKGRTFIDSLSLKALAIFNVARIPVEIVLYWLYIGEAVPQLMTFEGRNLDIISGLTAPFIYYFGFVKNKLNKSILIGWNVLCLGLY